MLTQHCPIEMAAEIVAERWNRLIIRDLMGSGRGFNDLHRCLPISRSMLAERLRRLERAGVVTRTSHGSGRVVEYRLAEAGRELEPLRMALGDWSVRRGPSPTSGTPRRRLDRGGMNNSTRPVAASPVAVFTVVVDNTKVNVALPRSRGRLIAFAAGSVITAAAP